MLFSENINVSKPKKMQYFDIPNNEIPSDPSILSPKNKTSIADRVVAKTFEKLQQQKLAEQKENK